MHHNLKLTTVLLLASLDLAAPTISHSQSIIPDFPECTDHKHFANPVHWPTPILPIIQNAPLPPMGWSSWNSFGDNPGPSDQLIREIADALVSAGLKDCGYVNLLAFDGAWWSAAVDPGRDTQGRMIIDAARWPHGIQPVCDYIHAKGLKVGGYTDIGVLGYCSPQQRGVLGYEQQDADQFAVWGWDYLKIDDHGPGNYYDICRAIANNASKRPIILSLSTPQTFPYEFGPRIANMWRVGGDITLNLGKAKWQDICMEFDLAEAYSWAQAPGRWNDLDMMVIGMFGITDEEAKSHLGMWAIRGAPLILGCDLRPPYVQSSGPVPKINKTQLAILKNLDVIAIDQDPLGASGKRVSREGLGEVYAKPLTSFISGEMAVLFLNRTEKPMDISVRWSDLGLTPGAATVRDLWLQSAPETVSDGYTAKAVPAHGTVMLRVHGTLDWSRPRVYEAESSYNTFTGTAHQRCKLEGFSATAGVAGVGKGADNSLQFNRVAVPETGSYTLDIFYSCAEERHGSMSVNGMPPVTLTFPAPGTTRRVGRISLEVPLKSGDGNIIGFTHASALMPILDRIRIRPLGTTMPNETLVR